MKKLLSILLIVGFLAGGVFLGYATQPAQYKVSPGDARWNTKLNAGLDALWDSDTALNTLITGWAIEDQIVTMIPVTCTFSDNNTFTVPGDYTSRFPASAVVQIQVAAGMVYSTVASSSYAAPTTTVNLNDTVLTSPIARVYVVATRDGLWPNGPGYIVARDYGVPGQAALTDALAAAGSLERTIILSPGTWSVTANTTIPANITLKPERGAILAIATGKTLTISGPLDAGLYQIFSCTGTGKVVFGAGAVKEVYPEWWAVNTVPGTTDMSVAFQAALNAGLKIKLAASTYSVTGLKHAINGQIVEGSGTKQTEVYCPTGYAFRNYTDADGALPTENVTAFKDLVYRDFTLKGDQTIDTNDYKTVLGTSKPLTTVSINGGFRFKLAHNTEINNVIIQDFHRGIDEYGGANLTVLHSRITNCEVGWKADTGASWGNASWKAALNSIAQTEIFYCWYGINWVSGTQFHMGPSFSVIFCNTAVYLSSCVDGLISGADIEYSCEGININGNYTNTITIDRPTFSTYTGDISGANAWGTGYSINVNGVATYSTIYVTNTPIIDGNSAYADSGQLIFDGPVSTNYTDKITPVVFNNFVYFKNIKNTMLYPDPALTRHGALIEGSTGITSLTYADDGEGNNALVAVGANNGLAYNGLRFYVCPYDIVNPEVTTRLPLRISYEYQYSGTSTIPYPFGPYVLNHVYMGATNITDTGGKWIRASFSTVNLGILYNTPYASGGFNGTLKIRKIYFSYGYGMADSYSPDPAHGFVMDGIPSAGSWMKGDTVRMITLAEAGSGGSKYVIRGWLRLITGAANVLNTDWVQDRALTGN